MTLNVCWSAKGGSGTTVVAAALALGSTAESLLIDLDGELPAALGVPEPSGQGLSDWFASDAAERSVLDLAVTVASTTRLVPRGRWRSPRLAAVAGAAKVPRPPPVRGHRRRRVRSTAAGPPRRAHPRAARHPAVLPVAGTREPPAATRRRRAPRAEPGRSLTAADVARALGAPVVAEVTVDPAIARAVDAGLLAARLPKAMLKALQALQVGGGHRARRPTSPAATSTTVSSPRCAGRPRANRAAPRPPCESTSAGSPRSPAPSSANASSAPPSPASTVSVRSTP